VARRGWWLTPRSRSLIARRLRPARSASSLLAEPVVAAMMTQQLAEGAGRRSRCSVHVIPRASVAAHRRPRATLTRNAGSWPKPDGGWCASVKQGKRRRSRSGQPVRERAVRAIGGQASALNCGEVSWLSAAFFQRPRTQTPSGVNALGWGPGVPAE